MDNADKKDQVNENTGIQRTVSILQKFRDRRKERSRRQGQLALKKGLFQAREPESPEKGVSATRQVIKSNKEA